MLSGKAVPAVFKDGEFVFAKGLASAKELNGQLGRIKCWYEDGPVCCQVRGWRWAHAAEAGELAVCLSLGAGRFGRERRDRQAEQWIGGFRFASGELARRPANGEPQPARHAAEGACLVAVRIDAFAEGEGCLPYVGATNGDQ